MLLRSRLATIVSAGALVTGTLVLGLPTASSLPLPGIDDVFRPQLVTVDTPERSDKELLQTLGLDLTEHAGHDYVEVVLHSATDVAALTGAGLPYDVRIPDLVRRSAEVNAANEQYAATTASSALPSGRTAYRTLDDYEDDLASLAADHPAVVKSIALPHRSVEGRTVHGVEIGTDVHRAESGRPVFLLMGLHHAREWPSGELAMEFAVDLAQGYGSDPRITELLDSARVIVVPVVNPDGFDLSRTDGGVIDLRELDRGDLVSIAGTPGHAYRRKNCRIVDGEDTPAGACRVLPPTSNLGAGSGVDLNRNYGGFWGGPGAAGPEPDPLNLGLGVLDPTYRGAAPFSEPEIQNVRELVSGRQVTMMISNHTFSNLILRPNGVHPDTIGHDGQPVGDAPDEEALKDLGAKMAAANGYANIHGWELYDTTGTTEDWSYNATGGFGYTFEIGEHEFHPPFAEVVDEYVGSGEHAGAGNREAYLVALEHAVDPETHALVTGRAPAGAELRLTKTFQTPTWESAFEDSLDSSITVGATGTFRWHVNPSTRPVVQERTVRELAETPYHSETFQGTVMPLESSDHDFTVDAPADALEITLDPTLPADDYDLELYRRTNG
ncbi:M14 family metallopeptidase, partial [Nocardioides sp.]|uniref:M14 family metallopeptidase n=1 Tax=Nocardioides sp. TaxID=35761 RepID=UPI0027344F0D